jgi:hypothetical protein
MQALVRVQAHTADSGLEGQPSTALEIVEISV